MKPKGWSKKVKTEEEYNKEERNKKNFTQKSCRIQKTLKRSFWAAIRVILVQLPDGKYAYVGEQLYTFVPPEPILKFYSSANEVPYPVALSKSYVYFMLDLVYVAKTDLPAKTVMPDAYRAFYGHRYWPDAPLAKPPKLAKHKFAQVKKGKPNRSFERLT
jgi:hypothetical protein